MIQLTRTTFRTPSKSVTFLIEDGRERPRLKYILAIVHDTQSNHGLELVLVQSRGHARTLPVKVLYIGLRTSPIYGRQVCTSTKQCPRSRQTGPLIRCVGVLKRVHQATRLYDCLYPRRHRMLVHAHLLTSFVTTKSKHMSMT